MDLELAGKVAWVNGASSGLGRASAEKLAAEGAAVAISSRSEDLLKQGADEISEATGSRCIVVPLDVTDADAITEAHRRIVDELGTVDILVSNAGGPPPGGFDDFDDETLYAAFTLTTASAWRLTKAVAPAMKEKRSGRIIFLTSSSTKEIIPTLLLSNMMRAAVVGMAKTLSKDLGAHGIRVVCVAPGRVETKRLQQIDDATAARTGKPTEEIRAGMISTIPLGRYGAPDEFGDVVAWVASERASFINGTTVVVDGGMLNGVMS
jgi:3-oxoacyl-[acyl-carrier protein] reductase